MRRLVSVAVPVPGLDLLTYRVPDGLDIPAAGARVLVPLGTRRMTGVVVRQEGAATAEGHAPALKDVIDVFDATPFVPARRRRSWSLGGRLLRLRARRGDCGGDAALRVGRKRVARARHRDGSGAGGRTPRRRAPRTARRHPGVAGPSAWTPLRSIAYRLEHMTPGRRGRALPARAAVRALQADGLVEVDDVLEGQAEAFKTVRVAQITAAGVNAAAGIGARRPQAARSDRALARAPAGLPVAQLRERGVLYDVLQRLSGRGLVAIRREAADRDPFDTAALPADAAGETGEARALTPEQAAAYETLRGLAAERRFAAALLHGVTGSGKTEIYLRLARRVLRRRGGPRWCWCRRLRLTPALAGAFRQRFGERVAIQHSGLSDGERHDQWQRIRRGDVGVVVGTRSAVFAPIERSASSWWTRSTTAPTSRRRRRATTAGTWP